MTTITTKMRNAAEDVMNGESIEDTANRYNTSKSSVRRWMDAVQDADRRNRQIQFQVQLETHPKNPPLWFLFYADDYEMALDHLRHCMTDPDFIANTGTPIINTCRVSGSESLPKDEPTTVDIRPNWKFAMQVYIMALENGTDEGRKAARDDLMALAAWVDDLPPQGRTDAPADNSNPSDES